MLKILFFLSSLALIMNFTKLIWPLAVTFLSLGVFLLLPTLHSAHTYNFSSSIFLMDNLSTPLVILTLWITLLMIMASFKTLQLNKGPSFFMALILSLTIVLIITFSSHSTILFYISFETSLLPTLLIILGWGYQPERVQASIYLILYTVLASLPLLVVLLLLSRLNHSTFMFLPSLLNLPTPLHSFIWMVSILAFLVKLPLFLVHLWLPKAHVEAPVAGSMILAAILLKLGSYGLLRLLILSNPPNYLTAPPLIAIAIWGATITSLICIRQPDMKSLIAYSSVSHMGLMTAGMMTETLWAWQGSLAMMIAHGLSSSGLFSLANMSYESTNTRSMLLSKGIISVAPTFSLLAFFLIIANMAAPPSLNLLSEIILVTSIISFSKLSLFLVSPPTFLAAAYSLILFTMPHYGAPSPLSNPAIFSSARNSLILILHILPLFLLFLSPDSILIWN